MEDLTQNTNNRNSDQMKEPTTELRLCHIVKRFDFDGYGFNLHSEKGKPGQYVGKVDKCSPAENAGLKEGDRIIEVNGADIGSETHNQVVNRIKAIASEVRLLVIDPMKVTNILKQEKTIISATALTTTTGLVVHDVLNSTNNINMNEKSTEKGLITKSSITLESTKTINDKDNSYDIESTPGSLKRYETNVEFIVNETEDENSAEQSKNNHHSIIKKNNNNKDNNVNKNNIIDVTNNNPKNDTNFKFPTIDYNNFVDKKDLNLKMTAAEMRAKLLAKKKYDPKNDSVDIKKKFEIIQKL